MVNSTRTVFAILIGIIFQAGNCFAAECGFEEIQIFNMYEEKTIKMSNKLAMMTKEGGIGSERRLSLLLMYGELHSLYLIISRMKVLICVYCDAIKCRDTRVIDFIERFENANMGFYGKQFHLLELKDVLFGLGHGDLAAICVEFSAVADELSMISWRFYGRLYELRGEPTPPSP